MKMSSRRVPAVPNRWEAKSWTVCGIALVSFAAGSLSAARPTHLDQAKADGSRVFELNVYHAVPGKASALEARFRDASKLLAKHHLNVLGYWVPEEDPARGNTFIYLVAHASREEAKENWHAFHADPAFQEYVKSERANPLIETVDKTYMRPTDYSSLR